jgi:hypothetical protein
MFRKPRSLIAAFFYARTYISGTAGYMICTFSVRRVPFFGAITMARPFVTPDPKDRSVNEPTQVINSVQVLGLYNQENSGSKKERVVDSVKDWYKDHLETEGGWKEAQFHGNQCVLTADVRLGK